LIFSENNPDRNPLFDRIVSTVFLDSNENLWWGGWRPLLRYSLRTGKIDSFPNQSNVSSMAEDKHGRIWFTIHNNHSIDFPPRQVFHSPSDPAPRHVFSHAVHPNRYAVIAPRALLTGMRPPLMILMP